MFVTGSLLDTIEPHGEGRAFTLFAEARLPDDPVDVTKE
jgi:hypothetical protein